MCISDKLCLVLVTQIMTSIFDALDNAVLGGMLYLVSLCYISDFQNPTYDSPFIDPTNIPSASLRHVY